MSINLQIYTREDIIDSMNKLIKEQDNERDHEWYWTDREMVAHVLRKFAIHLSYPHA